MPAQEIFSKTASTARYYFYKSLKNNDFQVKFQIL